MNPKFKPMLADEVDLNLLKYPVMASPKLDGVRATIIDGEPLTRSLKPLANPRIGDIFGHSAPLDGEFIVGDPTSKSVFRDTMKVVSSHSADITDLRFFVFDLVTAGHFVDRLREAHNLIHGEADLFIPVPHLEIHTEDELIHMEETCLTNGYEGLMIRDPKGGYKFGRSTTREGTLLKMKRRLQSEAEIVGYQEQMHNANEAKVDNLGYTERSSHKANMVPTGVLGALVVRDLKSGVEFNIGTGFDYATRQSLWYSRAELAGQIVSYEFLPVGVKDKPRHPVFIGFRMKEDL